MDYCTTCEVGAGTCTCTYTCRAPPARTAPPTPGTRGQGARWLGRPVQLQVGHIRWTATALEDGESRAYQEAELEYPTY